MKKNNKVYIEKKSKITHKKKKEKYVEQLTNIDVTRCRSLSCHLLDINAIFQAAITLNAQASEIRTAQRDKTWGGHLLWKIGVTKI